MFSRQFLNRVLSPETLVARAYFFFKNQFEKTEGLVTASHGDGPSKMDYMPYKGVKGSRDNQYSENPKFKWLINIELKHDKSIKWIKIDPLGWHLKLASKGSILYDITMLFTFWLLHYISLSLNRGAFWRETLLGGSLTGLRVTVTVGCLHVFF